MSPVVALDDSTATRAARDGRAGNSANLLEVRNLNVQFEGSSGIVKAVEDLSYEVRRGEISALVGESGCGKSVSSLAVMRLLPRPAARVTSGEVLFEGRDLLRLSPEEMRRVRGRDIAMIFQEPMTSLNPVLDIGFQIMEPLREHLAMDPDAARQRALELLHMVGMADPVQRLRQFPHQLSGGMRQRVMIAIGLACNPKLIIADEPTTALDVTIQAQILQLMRDLSRQLDVALVLITHNLGIVARYADRVNVMYAAQLVERGSTAGTFLNPRHPYTRALLRSVPRLDLPRAKALETIEGAPPSLDRPFPGCRFAPRCAYRAPVCEGPQALRTTPGEEAVRCVRADELDTLPPPRRARVEDAAPLGGLPGGRILVEVASLEKRFEVPAGRAGSERLVLRAVRDVSFAIREGTTLGLVGETGCGKTTVARLVLKLEEATAGAIRFDGTDIVSASRSQMRELRRKIQVVFQDPFSSLNPRMTVEQILEEPLRVYRLATTPAAIESRIEALLEQVGILPQMAERYPHELSGGQRQRIGIARALAMEPRFIVCDEPVSALDVSIQGQIINLLEELQKSLGLTYLFIAHDLAVVRHISDQVAVMYLGRVVELADSDVLYAAPRHPYTKALLEAVPIPDPTAMRCGEAQGIRGEMPSALRPPSGCAFRTRCPLAEAECARDEPSLREVGPGHHVACFKT